MVWYNFKGNTKDVVMALTSIFGFGVVRSQLMDPGFTVYYHMQFTQKVGVGVCLCWLERYEDNGNNFFCSIRFTSDVVGLSEKLKSNIMETKLFTETTINKHITNM